MVVSLYRVILFLHIQFSCGLREKAVSFSDGVRAGGVAVLYLLAEASRENSAVADFKK